MVWNSSSLMSTFISFAFNNFVTSTSISTGILVREWVERRWVLQEPTSRATPHDPQIGLPSNVLTFIWKGSKTALEIRLLLDCSFGPGASSIGVFSASFSAAVHSTLLICASFSRDLQSFAWRWRFLGTSLKYPHSPGHRNTLLSFSRATLITFPVEVLKRTSSWCTLARWALNSGSVSKNCSHCSQKGLESRPSILQSSKSNAVETMK